MSIILIADDLELNREILKAVFVDEYEILEAADGTQTIELLDMYQNQISLVLLDLIMPEKNGFEILEYMQDKGYSKKIPVIMITGEAGTDEELKAYQMGASEIIRKPFSMRIVKNRSENIIELFEHRRQIESELALRTEQLRIEEKARAHADIQLMLSQIRPHFLHNTLANIRYLCEIDPEMAADALDHFSRYLRENFESMNANNMVSLSNEVEHVKNYLYIEKLRFGDRLKVEWDLQENTFLLPVMTLQPLVENAVRNGICQKAEGGTVTIRSAREAQAFMIEILDDAARDGIKEMADDDIILSNVKRRIEDMCNGKITWEYLKHGGMRVHIRIPV